jgi:hypothetical protein
MIKSVERTVPNEWRERACCVFLLRGNLMKIVTGFSFVSTKSRRGSGEGKVGLGTFLVASCAYE